MITCALSTMKFYLPAFVFSVFGNTAFAANCQNSAGVANGQCVKYYEKANCNRAIDNPALGSYKPDCSGACFNFQNFRSVSAVGDGTYGTNCEIFKDLNCQNKLGQTGNTVVYPPSCFSTTLFPGAKSMRCYYRC
jgi:hypothetical protein